MKKKISSLLAATLLVTGACNSDLLEVKNENAYSDATYFRSAKQFDEAVIATYSVLLHNGMFSRDWYYLFDMLGNDAEKDTPLLGDLLQLHNYSFGASHQQITDLWRSLYRMIFRANLVIDKADEWNPTLQGDIDKKQQYIAEAHFLKGLAEFYLVNLWGRVPLKPDYESANEFSPRASVEEVWQAVELDLSAAIEGLPVSYGTEQRGRATKGAAIAMLGKAYLYQKKYAQAEAELEKLTRAPYTYTLNPDYDDQFSENNNISPETIFDIQHKWADWSTGNQYYMFGGQEAWGGKATHTGRAMEYGWNDWRNVFISQAAVKAFTYTNESGADYIDPRAAYTFYGDAASGGDTDFCHTCPAYDGEADNMPDYIKGHPDGGPYPYPFNASNGYRWRKYEPYEWLEKQGGPQSNINTQVIRYADVLLMLAEAHIEQGEVAQALPLINQVRERVGAFEYTTLGSQENARMLLRRERQLELAGEQSRWFDLLRWGIAQQTLNAEKQIQIGTQPFQDRNVLLPIPQLEKNTNPVLAADIANDWN